MNHAINRVLDRIDTLDRTLHQRFDDLEEHLTYRLMSIERRTNSIGNSVPLINNTIDQSWIKLIDYSFQSL